MRIFFGEKAPPQPGRLGVRHSRALTFCPYLDCRLMLEYARVMSEDRDAMSFVYDQVIHGDPHLPA
jgi:hypothetical protein